MDRLLKTREYEQLCSLLSGDTNGKNGITDLEVQHLSWLGTQVPNNCDVVEIGSHRGKSICAIGCGVRHAGHMARLFAIDLWTKGKGKTFAHYSTDETWEIFNSQIASVDLTDMVHARMMSSKAAAAKRGRAIHLLFIDADHKYKSVLQDYQLWEGFIPMGGWIAFHDFGTRFKGVDRVVKEEVIPSGKWGEDGVFGRIWSAKRIK